MYWTTRNALVDAVMALTACTQAGTNFSAKTGLPA
jgi:hypothetical protein